MKFSAPNRLIKSIASTETDCGWAVNVEHSVKGDWVNTVKQDLTDLNIDMNLEEIKNTSKEIFKTTVKEKVRPAAFNFLTRIQETKS